MAGIDAYTKLLLHANGVDGSKEIQDSGATGHVVTQNGTATLSTAQKKFGACSLLLDGDSDYLSIPESVNWYFNGDFAIDFRVRFATLGDCTFIEQLVDTDNCWRIYYDNSNHVLKFTHSLATNILLRFSIPWTPSADTWYWIALSRSGNDWHMYVDGTEGTKTKTNGGYTEAMSDFNAELHIGGTTDGYLNGYMDEVRISKGTDRGWTGATITVPTSVYTSDSYTVLLLHMESLDVSSTTTPKIPTFVGTAQLDTAQKEFGSASLLLDGNSDYVSVPHSDDWAYGTGNFTVDCWFRCPSFSAADSYAIVTQGATSGTIFTFRIGDNNAAEKKFYFLALSGGVTKAEYLSDAVTLNVDTWYHVAVVRNGTSLKIYLDGTSINLTENTAIGDNDTGDTDTALFVGARNSDEYFNGWIDELRISKGIARWTANFTPPTSEYTSGGGLRTQAFIL